MTDLTPTATIGFNVNKINPVWYLAVGIATLALTHMSFSIEVMAWISSVPFLMYLSLTKGWKSRLAFSLALLIAWSCVVTKIITDPIPLILVLLYSIPISLFQLPAYLLWNKFMYRRNSLLVFPAVMVIMEWIQYSFTPFASWGIMAYTQHDNLPLIQSVSLFGLAGLSFVIYWINSAIANILVTRKLSFSTFQLPAAVLIALIVFGAIRFNISKTKSIETITAAAIGTDSEVSGLPLPSPEENQQIKTSLFNRTRVAAQGGAKIISWTEASAFVMPEDEAEWIHSLQGLAAELGISLVAAYVVPTSINPLTYENKYQFIKPSGSISHSYLKHEPVPGEPAVKGNSGLMVTELYGSNIGAAICYDYDFPYMAKDFGNIDADIVVVPSSDWRGIDPIHTQMALFRGLEQGHSILRSTRFGLSAASTPYGEMTAQMSSFNQNDKIMYAQLPVKGVRTLYSMIHDTLVYICIIFILIFIAVSIRSRYYRDDNS